MNGKTGTGIDDERMTAVAREMVRVNRGIETIDACTVLEIGTLCSMFGMSADAIINECRHHRFPQPSLIAEPKNRREYATPLWRASEIAAFIRADERAVMARERLADATYFDVPRRHHWLKN